MATEAIPSAQQDEISVTEIFFYLIFPLIINTLN